MTDDFEELESEAFTKELRLEDSVRARLDAEEQERNDGVNFTDYRGSFNVPPGEIHDFHRRLAIKESNKTPEELAEEYGVDVAEIIRIIS